MIRGGLDFAPALTYYHASEFITPTVRPPTAPRPKKSSLARHQLAPRFGCAPEDLALAKSVMAAAVARDNDSPATANLDSLLHQAVLERVGKPRHDAWFQGKVRFELDGNCLTAGSANLFVQNILQHKFNDVIREAGAEVIGMPIELRHHIDPELFRHLRAEQAKDDARAKAESQAEIPDQTETKPNPKVVQQDLFSHVQTGRRALNAEVPKRRWRHLHGFVIGACNRVALAAATSVVEEPGQGPNPLVLHGPVGTGKTHLLEGVYAGLRRSFPEMRVLYVAAEDFTNRFVTALRFGKQSSFRKHFRACDVFLLDDLHFLAKKRATQEEFLHTFDTLLNEGRQIVLTCDCHPRLNDDFGPELMDRLLGGAIWGLLPPDPETRLAILRAKASGERRSAKDANRPVDCGTSIPDDVLAFLAERLRGNVRELEGALHSLRHFARVTGRLIDREMAREALGDLLRHAVRVVRISDVDDAVRAVLRLPSGALQNKERAWAVSHPRMLAVYLCRKHTAASFGEISKYFGGRSHGGAVAAEKKVREWQLKNEALAAGGREWPIQELIERVERELQS
jgi:chromosomal replication initiator protein